MSESIQVRPRKLVVDRLDGCYGVGELIDLQYVFKTEEEDSIEFEIKEGSGTLRMTNPGVGNAVFEAGNLAGDVIISVVRVPEGTEVASVDLHIVAPTYIQFSKSDQTLHTHGCADVGFCGELYLLPSGVSYENLLVREGRFRAVGSGYYGGRGKADSGDGQIPADVILGNRVNGYDGVYSGVHEEPWSEGILKASIPWEYCVSGQIDWVIFASVEYTKKIKNDGTVSIKKFNTDDSVARPSDPTQSS